MDEQDMRIQARVLSWMASLSAAVGEDTRAEAYLLELCAWCAFSDREEQDARRAAGVV